MYRFLLRPSWIVLTVLTIIAVPVCVLLGRWQLDRYHDRRDANELQRRNLAAAPVAMHTLAGPDRELAAQDRWRTVTATGTYDPAHQLLVRNRSQQGKAGFYVLTPLRRDDGTAVLVNRGWVASGGSAAAPSAVPAAPAGRVTVTGHARQRETPESSGIREREAPPGQVYLIDPVRSTSTLPYRLDRAYMDLTEQQPASDPAPAPLPKPKEANSALNLAYAVQWHVFAPGVVLGWLLLIRREAGDRRAGRTTPERGSPAWQAASKTTR